MTKRSAFAFIAVLLLSFTPAAHARTTGDVYLGYSRAGANLFTPSSPGMNGWQLAVHVKPIPFFGLEGDLSRYGASFNGGSQHATLFMAGPRVTVGTFGLSVFAHALGGFDHVSSSFASSSTGTGYALGGGADLPILLGLKLRVTGDYLGNNNAPPNASHYRIGAGVAYHF